MHKAPRKSILTVVFSGINPRKAMGLFGSNCFRITNTMKWCCGIFRPPNLVLCRAFIFFNYSELENFS